MGVTLTDVLLFGKAQLADIDKATLVIYRRNILRWSALGGYLDVIVKGVSPLSLPDAIADSLSYVKAFGGTEQRNLPDNYLQRQFIYMMDESYLLTDIVPTYDGRVEMDFQTTSIPARNETFIGGRSSSMAGIGLLFAKIGSDVVVDAFGTGSSDRYTSSVTATANTRYKFTFDNKVATLESGGSTLFTNTFTGTNSNGAELAINATNSNGTITGNTAGIYLYSFKAWNGQGELVADYVPAVQKGTVPVVGFYDTVSKTFKTATSGTFAAGGEAVPTPDAPMDIVCNNGVLKARHQSGLPLGYTLLDSAQSDGTQGLYIPYYRTNGHTYQLVMDVEALSYDGKGAASFGADYLGYQISPYSSNSWGWSNNNKFTVSGRVTLTANCSSDGKTTTLTDGINTVTNVRTTANFSYRPTLFEGYSNTRSSIKLYSAKFYEDDVLLFDLVPVTSNGTVGLYNKVDGTFLTPYAGTLIAGSAVSDPVEIYTDGTVETINVHGKNLFDKTTYIAGKYYNSSGNIVENPNYGMSDFIPMKSGQTFALSGRTPSGIALFNTSQVWQQQVVGQSFTAPYDGYFVVSLAAGEQDTLQVEQGSTVTDYVPYFNGGTATAEMLLKVGNYQDVQSIIDGVVTRNVGVKVFDGTEDWQNISGYYNISKTSLGTDSTVLPSESVDIICTHYETISGAPDRTSVNVGGNYVNFRDDNISTLTNWKQYLADQYAAGTPVIILYPLATPTTESVAGQTMQVQAGDNVLEITQASLNGLELEAEYQAAVSLTIQEVQDANLDPNVEVTIN